MDGTWRIWFISIVLSISSISLNGAVEPVYMCNSTIYCQGPILEAVNRLAIFPDSKHYVDMPLKRTQNETLEAFLEKFPDVQKIKKDELEKFLKEFFLEPDQELSPCEPPDWVKNPPNFDLIKDDDYRSWAHDLHKIWLELCRKINTTVLSDFEKNSLIYVPNNFIAPGGRFREYYYWDTYWIIKGLLVSGMYDTVKDIILNFAHLVDEHGMIPNGGRVYYEKRSQPPFFTPMVYEYYSETSDIEFLSTMLPSMMKELEFWRQNRTVEVQKGNKTYTVYRYRTLSNTPRPESYKQDVDLANQLQSKNDEDRANLYQNIASGAESGMDFGSRYFGNQKDLITIRVVDTLPVDLNAVLCWAHNIVHLMHVELGQHEEARLYLKNREEFKEMIEAVFYNETEGSWFDVDLKTMQHLRNFYPSNAAPLFTGCYSELDMEKPRKLYEYMNRTGALSYPSGIPSSLVSTGQQWDLPNGWAPSVHMIIEGFRKSGHQQMQEHAFQLADTWLKVNYLVYKRTTHMYEKYNVTDTTYKPGGGGEYNVQTGFGWTNGVVLDLLRSYGGRLVAPTTTSGASTLRLLFSFLQVISLCILALRFG